MKCKHCNENIELRNPSGYCDHLYYPENCGVCNNDPSPHDILGEVRRILEVPEFASIIEFVKELKETITLKD